MDITSIDPWQALSYRVANATESYPPRWEVADLLEVALRELDAPDAVQELLVALVRGRSPRPQGAPQKGLDHWARVIDRRVRVYMAEAGFRRQSAVRAPMTRALQVVAKEEGIVSESLRRDIGRGLKGAPWGVRVQGGKDSVRAVFAQLLERGEIALDAEKGFTWNGASGGVLSSRS